jgi:N-methylhydantoinase A
MIRVGDETEALLENAGVAFARVDRVVELDMLYLGQTHTVNVAMTSLMQG